MDPPDDRGKRFLLGLMAIFGVLGLLLVWPFFSYVTLAVVTAFLARRPYARLRGALRRDWAAASAITFLVLLVLVVPLGLFAAFVMDDLFEVARGFSEGRILEERVRGMLLNLGLPGQHAASVVETVMRNARAVASVFASRLLENAATMVVGFFVFFFVLYFALLHGERLVAFVRRAAPLSDRRMEALLGESGRAVEAVFRGHVLVSLIQGALATIGWWLFGYPDPFLWGFVATVLALIPFTGAPLLIVPVGLWTAAEGELLRGLGFVVFGAFVVGIVDNFLRPYIIGRTGDIHPVFVLLGVLGGLLVFGLSGLFLGPLVLVLLRSVTLVWMLREEAKQSFGA